MELSFNKTPQGALIISSKDLVRQYYGCSKTEAIRLFKEAAKMQVYIVYRIIQEELEVLLVTKCSGRASVISRQEEGSKIVKAYIE